MIAGDKLEKVQVSSLTSSSSASAPRFSSSGYGIILIIEVYTRMICHAAQIIVSPTERCLSVEDTISGSMKHMALKLHDFM
jgi:hypothetical protein